MEPLFFLHVPRTGGTSLLSYLDQQFAPGEVCPAHEQHEFEALEAEGRLQGYRFYRGHFGINFADHVEAKGRWITFLRDPVERVVSSWRHMRDRAPPFSAGQGLSAKQIVDDAQRAGDLDFPDFCQQMLDEGRLSFFNQATAALARGRGWGLSQHEQRRMDEETLELAKANLRCFHFVGTTEKYSESLSALQVQLGLPTAAPLRLNAAPTFHVDRPGMRDVLHELTRFDRLLYESVIDPERTVPSDPLYLNVI
jgi:hypothetical protein